MIIERLDLIAFGRFSGESIDLSAGPTRFHLVYGPNESGKSTSLRAIHAWLFGIPVQSDDNFLHNYSNMRVGGRLRDIVNDKVLDCVRRKGRQKTLMLPDESRAIDPGAIGEMLRGIDAETFSSKFGLSHEALVEGGREILKGEGELGEVLFAAGTGTGTLRAVQRQLDKDRRQLFIAGGSTGELNRLLSEYKDAKARLRPLLLPSATYQQKRAELDRAIADAAGLSQQIAQESARLERLRAYQSALELLPQRAAVRRELEELGTDIPLLDETFTRQRRERQDEWSSVRQQLEMHRKQVAELTERREALRVETQWLEGAAAIRGLMNDLGEIGSEASKVMQWQQQVEGLDRDLTEVAGALGMATGGGDQGKAGEGTAEGMQAFSGALLPDDTVRAQIDEMVAEHSGMIEKRESARVRADQLRDRLTAIDAKLAELTEPPNPGPLEEALQAIGKPTNWTEPLTAAERERQAAERRVADALRKLRGFSGDTEAARKLVPPSASQITELANALEQAKSSLVRAEQMLEAATAGLREAQGKLDRDAVDGELPTQEQLEAARSDRDAIVDQVDDAMGRGEAVATESLAALRRQIALADQISDRLLAAHDRVVRREGLETAVRLGGERLAEAEGQVEQAGQQAAEARRRWDERWAEVGVVASDPETMRVWISDHANFLDAVGQADAKSAAEQSARDRMRQHLVSLRTALSLVALPEPEVPVGNEGEGTRERVTASGGDLDEGKSVAELSDELIRLHVNASDCRDRLRRLVDQWQDSTRQRETVASDWEAARGELMRRQLEWERWESRWADLTRGLTGQESARPEKVHGRIRQVDHWRSLLTQREQLLQQIDRSLRNRDDYVGRVRELAGRLGDDEPLRNDPLRSIREIDERVRKWSETAARQAELAQKRDTLGEQIERLNDQMRETGMQEKTLRAGLERLCQEAGCERIEELPKIEQASATRREREREQRVIDQGLRALAKSEPLESFIRAAGELPPESLKVEIEAAATACQRLQDLRAAQDQLRGKLEEEVRQMDGSDEAARLQQEQENRLSTIRRQAERYAELTIAQESLKLAIDEYRQQNEGPILGKASAYFQRVTGGEYESLRVDFDDKDQPRLVGVRPAGLGVVAANHLSDGTADALYLSLRLASLEVHLDERNPVPLIVDDCLIQFDDDRASSALAILSEMARRTQVILFTHHRHLIELAAAALPADGYHVHELGK